MRLRSGHLVTGPTAEGDPTESPLLPLRHHRIPFHERQPRRVTDRERGPAFGVWTYDPQARAYLTRSRLYRYNPDGSFAGVNQVERTLKLSRDGDQATSEITVRILGPNEELLATDCASQQGTRSL